MKHPNKEIMEMAIKLARDKNKKGGHAVAAIIVKGDKILGKAFTTVVLDRNPTNHAEMNVIRKVSKKLKSFDISGCWLYSTYEPCPMCASASVWARLEGIVYGASMDDRNEKYTQRILIPCEKVLGKGDPKLKLHKNFMRKECKKLMLL